eukprot:g47830.t1
MFFSSLKPFNREARIIFILPIIYTLPFNYTVYYILYFGLRCIASVEPAFNRVVLEICHSLPSIVSTVFHPVAHVQRCFKLLPHLALTVFYRDDNKKCILFQIFTQDTAVWTKNCFFKQTRFHSGNTVTLHHPDCSLRETWENSILDSFDILSKLSDSKNSSHKLSRKA